MLTFPSKRNRLKINKRPAVSVKKLMQVEYYFSRSTHRPIFTRYFVCLCVCVCVCVCVFFFAFFKRFFPYNQKVLSGQVFWFIRLQFFSSSCRF